MNSSSMEEILQCPLCNSTEYKNKYTIASIKINECKKCSFAFTNPRLKREKILELYTSDYFNNEIYGYKNYLKTEILRKKNFSKWITDGLKHLKEGDNKSALDIGCAAGLCLEELRKNNFTAEGIELNKSYAELSKRKGFKVYDTPLLNVNISKKFDIITLFDVLEHLDNVPMHLHKIHSLLNNDGIVVLITPNYGSLARRILGKKWFQFKPLEHINYFTVSTLKKIALESGFGLVTYKKAGQYCDKNFLIERFSAYGFPKIGKAIDYIFSILPLSRTFFYVPTSSIYMILKK